ncbi:hypothetical protein ACJRO7_028453 [Eucalyptus globulus]|uniref:Secreted protein n=1 Tax=Eucalyptus globulus TaxID=34317 RepID=A0ABD3JWZ7_EUCGL
MEKLTPSKLVFCVMPSALALDILYIDGPMIPAVEARGDFQCFASRCVNRKFICREDFPPLSHQASSSS